MSEKKKLKEVYLAGGCFWGLEAYMKKIPGVYDTDVGYANGGTENPSYEDVCRKNTGHAETVHVSYDPEEIDLHTILKAYFKVVDPTSVNRQGNDRGSQYRSGIYYVYEEDIAVINYVVEEELKKRGKKVVTEVTPLDHYYPAEEYHQDYLEKNPGGYCHINLEDADEFIEENDLNLSYISRLIRPESYKKPDEGELKEKLTDIQYDVTQNGQTERAFSNEYASHYEAGLYVDVVTGEPLFTSFDKFESGCGWPSFSKPVIPEVVKEYTDTSYHMIRTEVKSRSGDSHLGHVFADGPKESGGLRYCINSAAIRFVPVDQLEREGYEDLKFLFE